MGAESLKKQLQSEIPITHRSRTLSAEWVDRLLLASCDIPPGAGVEEVASTLFSAITDAVPDIALGVSIPSVDGPIVVRRSQRTSYSQSPDPARLFSEFRREWVVSVPFEENATLHLATDDEDLFGEDGPYHGLLDRLNLTLGGAMRHSRAYEQTRVQTAEVRGLQAQVIQSEKLASLGQLAAGIVHELNNPLTSIVAYSDYLRRKAEKSGGEPADIERLARINEAAERILHFARDLIAYSRPSAEAPHPVAIHDVIDRALVFCEHVVDQAGVRVEKDFGEVAPVRGVSGQLTQVFVNLFTNACQAMRKEGGRLTISTAPNGSAVSIRIGDDGHGIGSEHMPRIFEPFFTTKTDGSGTGLGLSIVRNIVRSHGGTIRVEGQSPHGTVFCLELPAHQGSR